MTMRTRLGAIIGTAGIAATFALTGAGTASASNVTTLDVVNAYTPNALAAAGGLRPLEDLSAKSVAAVNTAMNRSNIPIHVNLVGMTETTGTPESQGDAAVLTSLGNPSLSTFATAKSMRNTTKAHVLMLFTAGTSEGGLSFVNERSIPAYSVGTVDVAEDIQTQGLNYAHEFGHVLGAQHDIATDPTETGTGLGYANPTTGERDLMSYTTACDAAGVYCTLEDAYSDPNLTLNGHVMGTSQANIAGMMTQRATTYAGLGSVNNSIASVAYSTPAAGQQHVSSTAAMRVGFTTNVTGLSARLETASGQIVSGSTTWNSSTHVATITPHGPLPTGSYRIALHGTNLPEQTIPFTVGYGASAIRAVGNSNGTVSVTMSKPSSKFQDSVHIVTPSGSMPLYLAAGSSTGNGVTTYTMTPNKRLPHGTYKVVVTNYVANGMSVAGPDASFTITL